MTETPASSETPVASACVPAALRCLESGLGWVSALLERLCDVLVVVLGLVVVATLGLAIVTRYTNISPFLWSDEVARYCTIWAAFLGASSALKKGNALSFDLFVDALPPHAKECVRLLIDVAILIFLCIFLHSARLSLPITLLQKSSALSLPMLYPALGLVFGSLFMVVHVLHHLLGAICRVCFTKVAPSAA